MTHGSKISCMGIIGDGCGGGREFIVKDGIFFVHDPMSGEDKVLLENIKMPQTISKKGCVVSIKCADEDIKFNLSLMQKL